MAYLTDIFNLPEYKRLRWTSTSPDWSTESGRIHWNCEFETEYGNYPYYAEYSSSNGLITYRTFQPTDVLEECDYSLISECISIFRILQHVDIATPKYSAVKQPSHWYNIRDMASVLKYLKPEAMAAYKACKEIRESFPRIDSIITGSNPEAGFVYLLDDKLGHYKIGRSGKLDKRIYQLGTQPPFKIELISAVWMPHMASAEDYLHDKYDHCRLNGEWFALSSDELLDLCEWMYAVTSRNLEIDDAYKHHYEDWRDLRCVMDGWYTLSQARYYKEQMEMSAETIDF